MKLNWSIPLTYPIAVKRADLGGELRTVGCAARFITENVPPSSRDGEVLSVISCVVQAARGAHADDILLADFAIEALLSNRGFLVERIHETKDFTDIDEVEEREKAGAVRPNFDVARLMMAI